MRNTLGITLAAFNAVLSSLALAAGDDHGLLGMLALTSFLLFGAICVVEAGNVLFLARTFILGFIGYFPLGVKVLLGPHALFSNYEPATQGLDIVIIMYVATSLALLSNEVGLAWARRSRPTEGHSPQVAVPDMMRSNRFSTLWVSRWRIAALAGLALTFLAAAIFIRGYGEFVFTAGYGGSESAKGLPFGSVGVVGAIGIYSLYVAGLKGHVRHWKPLVVVAVFVYVILSQLLVGLRQDAMSVLFGLVVLYGIARRKELRLRLRYVPVLAIGYVFFEIWGIARSAIALGIPLSVIARTAFTMVSGENVVTMGTISPIATTFANTVYMIDHGMIDYTLGTSYGEWLLRIPPEALYPDRPRDYALMFEEHGLASGGGFFELGEAYMNFGLLGTAIIPGIISLLMAKSYYYAVRRQTVFSYFLAFTFLAVFLRGTWYQSFAFFRTFLVSMLLFAGYVFGTWLLRAARSRPVEHAPSGAA